MLWPPFYTPQSSIVWMCQSLFNPFSIDRHLAYFQLSEDKLLNPRNNKIKYTNSYANHQRFKMIEGKDVK